VLGSNDKQDHAVPREGNGIKTAEGDGEPGMGRLQARNASQQESWELRCHIENFMFYWICSIYPYNVPIL
jgi:hypothetical protein